MTQANASPTAPYFYFATAESLTADPPQDVALSNLSNVAHLWVLEIDNTLNAVPVYVKFWDMGSAVVTVGSTPPTMQFTAPPSTKQTYSFAGPGPALSTDPALNEFSWACDIMAGTTDGGSPVAAVAVRMLFQQVP